MAATAHPSNVMPAPADVVYATPTDIVRMPAWNAVVTEVQVEPAGTQVSGDHG